jgi:multidrug efflux pump subunit AcrB
MILPIYFGIFKARMLPKSDKDQVYLWVDAPRGTSAEKMYQIHTDIEKFFLKNTTLSPELNIVKSVSSTV